MGQRIEDHALIGDCETAALVGRDGSLDWLCWPRFDSGAVFASLLGNHDNGHWSLGPTDPEARLRRRYVPASLILETEIETGSGTARRTDFMPLRRENTSHVARLIHGQRSRWPLSL